MVMKTVNDKCSSKCFAKPGVYYSSYIAIKQHFNYVFMRLAYLDIHTKVSSGYRYVAAHDRDVDVLEAEADGLIKNSNSLELRFENLSFIFQRWHASMLIFRLDDNVACF
jgi:hypothetical protein